MIVNYTDAERQELDEIERHYALLIDECENEIERLRPDDPQPDYIKYEALQKAILNSNEQEIRAQNFIDEMLNVPELTELQKKELAEYQDKLIELNYKITVYHTQINEIFEKWEAAGSDEWRAAKNRRYNLMEELADRRQDFQRKCERRQFNELEDNPERIKADARNQIEMIIKNRYEDVKRRLANGETFFNSYAVTNGDDFYINPESIMTNSKYFLWPHYEFFQDDPEGTRALNSIILEAVKNSPYTSFKELGKTVYRTRAKARDIDGAITEKPNYLMIPTLESYKYSTSLYRSGEAYLQPLTSMEGLRFQKGMLFLREQPELEAELQDLKTKESIENIDLLFLRSLYCFIYEQFVKSEYQQLPQIVDVYLPVLAEYMGLSRPSKKNLDDIIEKIQSFHNVVGVVEKNSLYQVLNFESYNEKTNTVSFSSPYLCYLIKTIYRLSIKKGKDGKPKLKENGLPDTKPVYSFMVKPEIATEKNKAAVENVIIIVTVIEKAGNSTPNIKFKTIIERNPQLKERLEESTNKNQLLKRTFVKTWELLRNYTKLEEHYKNIVLPNPKDPRTIPTTKMLNNTLYFPHEGKIKDDSAN